MVVLSLSLYYIGFSGILIIYHEDWHNSLQLQFRVMCKELFQFSNQIIIFPINHNITLHSNIVQFWVGAWNRMISKHIALDKIEYICVLKNNKESMSSHNIFQFQDEKTNYRNGNWYERTRLSKITICKQMLKNSTDIAKTTHYCRHHMLL